MGIANAILKTVSFIFRKIPSFRYLKLIYFIFNSICLRLGANPVVSAKMKDGTKIIVDLRTKTEVNAFYSGSYDESLISVIKEIIDVESYFLDIGANIGFYTVAIAQTIRNKGGSGKVIAFEPFDGNYKRLLENIALNGCEKYCSTRNIGLSNAAVESELTLREDFFGGSGTGNAAIPTSPRFDQGFNRVLIELNRLDDIWQNLNRNGRHKIDFIKMDIEGHEDYCLQGGQRSIQENRPIILMEVNKPYYVSRGG